MNLSVLICSLKKRESMLDGLLLKLCAQGTDVEVLTDVDEGEVTVGFKRQRLLEKATGSFIVFIDDDDEISDDYLPLIDKVISETPEIDCIGIQGWITTDDVNRKEWRISKEYGKWYEASGVYYRTPNHISPVRREIALKIGFKDKKFGEDYDYSMGILPYLKKEIKIDKDIYHYKFRSIK